MIDERTFNELADAELARIEGVLEEATGAFDLEVKADGVLEIEFDDGGKIVINRHTAAREIWVASRSGGFHFRYEDGRWLGTRDHIELLAALIRMVSQQSGNGVLLGPTA